MKRQKKNKQYQEKLNYMIPYFFFEEKTPIEYSTKELCDLFLSKQNTHFIYDTHREAQTPTYIRKEISDINKSLEKSNSHFTIILGGEPTNEWGKKSMFIYNMINLNRTIVDNHSNESLENYTNVSCIYNNNDWCYDILKEENTLIYTILSLKT